MKLLIYHTGALGDFILFSPVLDACLKSRIFHAVTLAGQPDRTRALFPAMEELEVVPHDSRIFSDLFADSGALNGELSNFLNRFDTRVFLSSDPVRLEARILQSNRKGTSFFFPSFPPFGSSVRLHHEKILDWLGIGRSLLPPFGVKPLVKTASKVITVHPGSGSPRKNWPEESWLRFLERLSPAGVTILAGPAEGPLPLLSKRFPVIRPANMTELRTQLETSTFFLGQDSGPSHFAGRLGIPGMVRVPETNRGFWTPGWPSLQVTWIRDGMADPSPDEWVEQFGRIHGPGG